MLLKIIDEMVTEVYLKDNGEAIEVRNLETDEVLYHYSYMHEKERIWDYADSWRILRHTHLRNDLYKEVFKCECGEIVKIPEKIEANIDEANNISFNLKCKCGKIITIKCDTLTVGDVRVS